MKFYNCLFTILEKYIYTGLVKELSPNDYSRVHTVVIISFTIMTNIIVLKRYVGLSFTSDYISKGFIVIGVCVFLFHYFFIYSKLSLIECSLKMKIITLGYIFISFFLLII